MFCVVDTSGSFAYINEGEKREFKTSDKLCYVTAIDYNDSKLKKLFLVIKKFFILEPICVNHPVVNNATVQFLNKMIRIDENCK